jgi:hypothetical protein
MFFFPGVIGLVILFGAVAGGVAVVSLVSGGGMAFGPAIALLVLVVTPGLVGGWACFYVLLGGLGERLQVQGEALDYRAPLFRRRIPIRDILIVHRWPRMLLRYHTPKRVVTLRLPNWSRGWYAEEFIKELMAVNPDIELIIGPLDADEWGDKLRRLKETRLAQAEPVKSSAVSRSGPGGPPSSPG